MFFFKKDFLLSDSLYKNDTIAQKISWKPLDDNKTPIQGLKLVLVNTHRLEFRISILDKVFYMFIILVGIGILGYSIKVLFVLKFDAFLLSLVVGASFLFAGSHMWKRHSTVLVFDGIKKIYFEDDKNYEFYTTIPFDRIYAIQLLSYTRTGTGSEDTSSRWCDLNLVLDDYSRIYVCSYNKQYKKIENYANKISKLINKPVWNAL
ncbi:MAG: Unknown protein [uncultured Sulfurovum sp.]|uniref:Uncharacterized protein n=1 Tax=uncultured Sulfurovum sp. TaxID=269237 RepID=A0A6S6RU84_9BACT|nr:MAG: Unknown protein [uncultured Sulfurovum sp.]